MDALDVEVFAAGTHGGMSWSTADLDQMVANFAALADHIKPPVKLGHDDTQVLGGQRDGQPALGWVQRLRRQGDKLVATIGGIPKVLRELVQQGRYRRVSAEIYPQWHKTPWEENLKSGVSGRVLSAVAFLGADVPEVKTLEDLGKVLACDLTPVACAEQAMTVEWETERPIRLRAGGDPRQADDGRDPKGSDDMTKDEIEKLVAESVATAVKAAEDAGAARLKATEDRHAVELKSLREAQEAAQRQLAEQARQAQAAAAAAFVERHTVQGNCRMTQAQAKIARVLMERLPTETVLNAGETGALLGFAQERQRDVSLRALFEEFIGAGVEFSQLGMEISRSGEAKPAPKPNDPLTVETALREIAEKYKLNLSERADRNRAAELLVKERPELVPDYRRPRAA